MIEEAFVRMYAHDFVQFAGRAELGQDVEPGVARRMSEARSHAVLMDARKGADHLASLVSRLRDEAAHFSGRMMLKGTDPEAAARRHRQFLDGVADSLSRPAKGLSAEGSVQPAMSGLTRRTARRTLPIQVEA